MGVPLNLLVIDDSETDAELVTIALRHRGYDIVSERVDTDAGLRTAVEARCWDIVVCDYGLPGFDAREALTIVREAGGDVPFVILSGTIGEEAAVEALKAGARDVVLKTNLGRIGSVVDRELREADNQLRRRESELALTASEARKSAILDSALDAVITVNSEGRIIDFNPAAEAMFGYPATQVSGKPIADLIIPATLRQRHRDAFARHLATGESTILGQRIELSALRADGSEFPVELSITSGRTFDRPFFTAYLRDLTAQRKTEEERAVLERQLRQSQKMESIGGLAGGIAHDFNNMLTVIRSVSRLLLDETSDEHVCQRMHQIDAAAEHAAKLTQQLLAFSRQQVLQPLPSNLTTIVEETLQLVRRVLGEDIELALQLDPSPTTIIVDRAQLQQIILNLSVNARDAMPTGGTLTVRTATAELDATYAATHLDVTPGPYVILEISDTGSGIDKETQQRVFDPFFTTKREGTGLGLATVHGIVAQSGGHIYLYSEPRIGTTFKIYLPRIGTAPTQAPPKTISPAASLDGSETILLVEDADLLRPLIAEVLQTYGYTVLTAASPHEALHLIEQQTEPVHLLLTDVVMPQMNGRELAETLLAQHPDLKVLFSSGYPNATVIRQGITQAHVDFIQKPYLGAELAAKVRTTLDARPR